MTKTSPMYDIAIIGGGINGCGCAADAALRNLSVFLCDKGSIAGATSSSSSKLIHGGLRYLEYYDFALVKKALDERQRLLALAPHLVHPQPFVIPLLQSERPSWLLRTGLFVYDHLSFANRLPNSQSIDRTSNPNLFTPLKANLTEGFQFYDCATDDSRLTLANALQAKSHGAHIYPYTTLLNAEVVNQHWHLTLLTSNQKLMHVSAKTVINATGPWSEQISKLFHVPLVHHITLVKGSHLVVPRLYPGKHAYLLQHSDKRIIFIIPFHGYSMIGTTDVSFTGDLNNIHIDPAEIDYLLSLTNQYFNHSVQPEQIVHAWSGVRPLLASTAKNPSALSRDYVVEVAHEPAPIITILGGKITTYRQLAEEVINQLKVFLPQMPKSTTRTTSLPGAKLNNMDLTQYRAYANTHYTWLDSATLARYLENYGTRTELILAHCSSMTDLGSCFAPTFYAREIDYLCEHEWAKTVEDILWHHTKLGLNITTEGKAALGAYLHAISA